MRIPLSKILIGIALSVSAINFFAFRHRIGHPLVPVEWTAYCICWAMTVYTSFRDRVSGFPPWLIGFTWSWELIALLIVPDMEWTTGFYFVWWFFLSNWILVAVSRFGRHEFGFGDRQRWFWPQMIALIAVTTFGLYAYISRPGYDFRYLSVTGNAIVPFISLHFTAMMLYRKDCRGISLVANLFRILAQHLTILVRGPDEISHFFPQILYAILCVSDPIFLIAYVYKWRRAKTSTAAP